MHENVIHLENLGKQYHIGVRQPAYGSLRDTVTEALAKPFRRVGKLLHKRVDVPEDAGDTFWALRGVSMEIKQGEVVGVIGRNGSGKSTLLKMLSRIVVPTEGRAVIRGRVGSLLEVGTGFHHELTGRENIALNGAILGMKRADIARRFDEIVAFAEIEKFLDTPVKHYSTGMYLRLAFSVAAHLEPEILLVDEVLAVGDVRFQKKCLAKMEEVGKASRTVLFVSHNMTAVARLCERTILLQEGRVLRDGPTHEVLAVYLDAGSGPGAAKEWPNRATAPGKDVSRLRAVRVRNARGDVVEAIDIREPVTLEMEYDVYEPGHVISPGFTVSNDQELDLFSTADSHPSWQRTRRPAGRYVSRVVIPGNFLAEGRMYVNSGLATMNPVVYQFDESRLVSFEVVDAADGDSVRGDWSGRWAGVVRPMLNWTTEVHPLEDVEQPAVQEPTGVPSGHRG